MGSGTSAKKALKLLKAAGKDGNGRNGARVGDGLTPQVLLQVCGQGMPLRLFLALVVTRENCMPCISEFSC